MPKCDTCRKDYNETDVEEAKYHTTPVDCGQSCRCVNRPRCYMCGGSFCFCSAH